MTDLINVQFSYNGDLGILQHTTRANLVQLDILYINEVITYKEMMELKTKVYGYFSEELRKVLSNVGRYIN